MYFYHCTVIRHKVLQETAAGAFHPKEDIEAIHEEPDDALIQKLQADS